VKTIYSKEEMMYDSHWNQFTKPNSQQPMDKNRQIQTEQKKGIQKTGDMQALITPLLLLLLLLLQMLLLLLLLPL